MTTSSTRNNIAKRSEKMPTRSTTSASSSSVYDRLYRTGTASSKVRKEVAPVKSKNILMRDAVAKNNTRARRVRPRPKKRTLTNPSSGGDSVFNRLYAKGTASTTAKKSVSGDIVKDQIEGQPSRMAMKPKNHY